MIRSVVSSGSQSSLTVPKNNSTRAPAHADLNIGALLNDIVEEVEDAGALLVPQTNNVATEATVDKDRLGSSDGVTADEGVLVLDGVAADGRVSRALAKLLGPLARVVGLLEAGVNNLESLEVLAERGGETLVCETLRDERSVTAGDGRVVQEQSGESRWLLLVCHVAVPADSGDAVGKPVLCVLLVTPFAEDEVELGEALGLS